MPDSEKFGDRDVDTFGHILDRMGTLEIPNLQKLGMLNLHTGGKMYGIENPVGKITRLKEASNGKDTMTGHWEMMGIYTESGIAPIPSESRTITKIRLYIVSFIYRSSLINFLMASTATCTAISVSCTTGFSSPSFSLS